MFVFGVIAGTTPTTRYESQAGATGPQASFASGDWRFGTASHNAGSDPSKVPWVNIGNILTPDLQYAWVQAYGSEMTSKYAVADGFGFSIPSDMAITGIQVSLKGYSYTPRGGSTVERCYIEKGGEISESQCRIVNFGPSSSWVTVGGPTDRWGLSWRPSDINSNNFGAGLMAVLSPSQNAVRVYLDCIKIAVYYILDPVPTIDNPLDAYYYEGTTGHSITWQPSDNNPATYTVTKDGITVQSGSWTGGPIIRNVDNLPGGTYTYTCTVYDGYDQPASDSVQVIVNPITKYAVIVGIATYLYVGPNLNYPDDDADDWYNQLVNIGWSSSNIKMYGDGHLTATWSNVNDGLNWLGSVADANDIIVFTFSGHGSVWSISGQDHPCLCCYDYQVVDLGGGQYAVYNAIWDTDLAAKLGGSQAAKIFVFLDSCNSGGFGDDLMNMPNKAKVFCITTCTLYGYGYDDDVHENGECTYYFLHYSWQGHYGGSANAAMEDVSSYAVSNYQVWYYDIQHNPQHYTPPSSDFPQQFDGDTAPFYLRYP
jgi:hypothetical protein